MAIGLLVLRVIVGLLFVGHGTQKLFGWFGGHGPDGTAAFLGSLGYRPSRRMALVAGVAETLGGAMLTLGFLTPVACAAIIGVMVNATVAMHLRNVKGAFIQIMPLTWDSFLLPVMDKNPWLTI
jgi:putative oxidoreductase